jgi:prevent-host-death family protein
MAQTITATEANRRFSELLRQVGAGESFIVTSHGRPIARLAPAAEDDRERRAARDALLERLDRQPRTDAGTWTRAELYED